MNSKLLAKEYLERCKKRLKALELLYKERGYGDVVREAQEIVELCGKGILRAFGLLEKILSGKAEKNNE
jgi:hypothetical protein